MHQEYSIPVDGFCYTGRCFYPQVFKASILLKAYEQAYEPVFTDDASVVEKAGYHLHLTAGDTRNIKITFPEDIYLAESLIQSK